MFESFTLTQTIALILALYMVSAGIGMLTDPKGFAGIMDEFKERIGLTYIAAIVAFFLGAAIVALHNLWGSPLEIIVSLIGWAALLEGVLMLAFRRPFFTLVGAVTLHETFMKAYGLFAIAVAALLAWLVLA